MVICVFESASLMPRLARHLDLDHPGLEPVKAACAQEQWDCAAEALAEYYRRKALSIWFIRNRTRGRKPFCSVDAESFLRGVFKFQDLTGANPFLADGGLDWSWRGPKRDIEWTYFLNRHYIFNDAIDYHRRTGDPRFADFVTRQLEHWLENWPCPERSVENCQWRVLEAALRVGSAWPKAFYYLQGHEGFTPDFQVRMLLGIAEHGQYVRAYHTRYRNHATMELGGLLRTALYWPEIAHAAAWREYAEQRLLDNLDQAFYPDGVHKELSSMYHSLVAQQFLAISHIYQQFELPVPQEMAPRLKRTLEYLACSMKPDGYGQLNNDCDLECNRPFLAKQACIAEDPELLYVVTGGQQGRAPGGVASRLYPWAGHVLMRDGWTPQSQMLFFDNGPLGVSHAHRDKLHLSLYAGGRDLLVDSGRYTYKPGPMRDYFRFSSSHNVVLLDGRRQRKSAELTKAGSPLPAALLGERADFARGVFDDGYRGIKERAVHTRATLYLKGRFWVVVDELDCVGPHRLQALWHFHPHCTAVRRGQTVMTADPGQGNLAIVPLAPPGLSWRAKIVKGRRMLGIQGWYSPTYNILQPAPCAIYQAPMKDRAIFAWLLFPFGDEPPRLAARALSAQPGAIVLEVESPGLGRLHIAVRTDPGEPILFSDGARHDCDYIIAEMRDGAHARMETGCLPAAHGAAVTNQQ